MTLALINYMINKRFDVNVISVQVQQASERHVGLGLYQQVDAAVGRRETLHTAYLPHETVALSQPDIQPLTAGI